MYCTDALTSTSVLTALLSSSIRARLGGTDTSWDRIVGLVGFRPSSASVCERLSTVPVQSVLDAEHSTGARAQRIEDVVTAPWCGAEAAAPQKTPRQGRLCDAFAVVPPITPVTPQL